MGRGGAWAGVLYFAIVFPAGFAMGTLRVLAIEPRLGPATSVALELPVMLAVSWLAARYILRRRAAAGGRERLAMGLVGVVFLVTAETLLGLAFGTSLTGQVEAYGTARGFFTLLGQIGFALIPLLV